MVCSYHSSCLYLPVALVGSQVEGCKSGLHHVCQGRYVSTNDIDIDGSERKIYSDCVDELWMGSKPAKFKKVGHSTVYRTNELEEY